MSDASWNDYINERWIDTNNILPRSVYFVYISLSLPTNQWNFRCELSLSVIVSTEKPLDVPRGARNVAISSAHSANREWKDLSRLREKGRCMFQFRRRDRIIIQTRWNYNSDLERDRKSENKIARAREEMRHEEGVYSGKRVCFLQFSRARKDGEYAE